MAKLKYTNEYEIQASPKILYPYLQTPLGLSEWFAEKVTVLDNKLYHFVWNNEDHYARMAAHKLNKYVKFEFLDDANPARPAADASYIEFKIEANDMTGSTFLKITDYSEMNDLDELHELWKGLIAQLKEKVGG
ncbi:MAG: START-like domain-containing protein [Microscillaceae bacterium]|nr:START-like domain-containing protein [Microscillaceae bacterium]MDW8461807.1 START-like domain-containing protein [Cytophagales bacterium]